MFFVLANLLMTFTTTAWPTWKEGIPRCGMHHRMLATATDDHLQEGSLHFRYTLQRVHPASPVVFNKAYAIITISYFDTGKKLLSTQTRIIWPDVDFAELRKDSMSVPVIT